MAVYPVFLELAGRRCLVVGGGVVGRRKAAGLLGAGAEVAVVEPRPGDELRAMARESASVVLLEREFRDGDSAGAALVYACTDRPAVNAAVAADAAAAGALCCRADDGRASDFTAGAVLRRGDVCVAVSTSGTSPRLAALVRDRLAEAGLVEEVLGTAGGTRAEGAAAAGSEGAGRCTR